MDELNLVDLKKITPTNQTNSLNPRYSDLRIFSFLWPNQQQIAFNNESENLLKHQRFGSESK